MKNDLSIEDLVGRYLDREMTKDEMAEFERKSEVDPAVREELDFQKEIIHSIKESRRLELKSRLSDIQPPSTPFLHSVGLKIAAIASISAIVGTGAYFYFTQDDGQFTPIELSERPESTITKERIPTMPEITVPEEETFTPEKGTVSEIEAPGKDIASKDEEQKEQKISAPTPAPTVVRPDIAEISEESEPETGEMVEEDRLNEVGEIPEGITDQLTVETEKSRRFDFHYKFYNGKLFLLGDFTDAPYEIIELNSSSGKKYFLYYHGSYYRLSPSKVKPTPLEKLADEGVIEELQIIQQNK